NNNRLQTGKLYIIISNVLDEPLHNSRSGKQAYVRVAAQHLTNFGLVEATAGRNDLQSPFQEAGNAIQAATVRHRGGVKQDIGFVQRLDVGVEVQRHIDEVGVA